MLNSLDIEGRPSDTRVVVAMSGGVDSSVTAALLADAGYDVVGITLQLYDHGAATHRRGACCAGRDIHDARTVAERIGIPHYVLDYESRFKEAVIDRFAESYVAGETPVPCLECNQSIKFRDLLETARDLGAKVLATGHYVASRALPDGGRALYRAREAERDQSYFLFATTPAQLDFLRFPLGDRTKAETRELARHYRPVGRRQARQPGHLLRAERALCRHHRAAAARRRRARRDRRSRRPRARPARRHHPFHRRPAARARHRHRLAALCGAPRRAARAASWSVRAKRCAPAASACATSTGSARARSTSALDNGREVFVKVRSTRRAAAGVAARRRRRRRRSRADRRRRWRVARPGLRVLRFRRRPGARARRRHHRLARWRRRPSSNRSRQSGRSALIARRAPAARTRW